MALFRVADNEFNRAWYSDEIGHVYDTPRGYMLMHKIYKVNIDKLQAIEGPKIWDGHRKSWRRVVTFGFHDGNQFVTLPGKVEIKNRPTFGGRFAPGSDEAITFNGNGQSIRGYNPEWIVKEAGYILEREK